MSDVVNASLRDRLQSSFDGKYVLGRELGGGGMSRIFVARDEALGREIVVKVLAPELTEGMSTERFTREIRLAASLQQANIVPVASTASRVTKNATTSKAENAKRGVVLQECLTSTCELIEEGRDFVRLLKNKAFESRAKSQVEVEFVDGVDRPVVPQTRRHCPQISYDAATNEL